MASEQGLEHLKSMSALAGEIANLRDTERDLRTQLAAVTAEREELKAQLIDLDSRFVSLATTGKLEQSAERGKTLQEMRATLIGQAEADRDAWREDAERLATAIESYDNLGPSTEADLDALYEQMMVALAAHQALEEKGK